MEGLSKEYLCNSLESVKAAPINDDAKAAFAILLEKLIGECHELNPWKPIDNAPKDGRELLLYCDGTYFIGFWDINMWYTETGYANPTHYQELPPKP